MKRHFLMKSYRATHANGSGVFFVILYDTEFNTAHTLCLCPIPFQFQFFSLIHSHPKFIFSMIHKKKRYSWLSLFVGSVPFYIRQFQNKKKFTYKTVIDCIKCVIFIAKQLHMFHHEFMPILSALSIK